MNWQINWNSIPPNSPLGFAGRRRRFLPFAAIIIVIGTIYFGLEGANCTTGETIALLTVLTGSVMLVALVPWDRLPRWPQIFVPLSGMALVVMMQVFALPANSDLGVLLLVSVLWSALYGSAREALMITMLAVGSLITLEIYEVITGVPVGFTGWTEVAALSFTSVMLAVFIVTSRQHARVDQLTGIANRRAWDEVLADEINRARMHRAPVRVAMIDLDNFKAYNDTRGHAGGDAHLQECARAWTSHLRSTDVLARVGGEEFAVLLRELDDATAGRVMERIAQATPDGQTCSVGIAVWDGQETAGHLTLRADDALYEAKEAGRNRIVVAHAGGAPVTPSVATWSTTSR